jgi:hypothetical protein
LVQLDVLPMLLLPPGRAVPVPFGRGPPLSVCRPGPGTARVQLPKLLIP